jgi:hypothetical protein
MRRFLAVLTAVAACGGGAGSEDEDSGLVEQPDAGETMGPPVSRTRIAEENQLEGSAAWMIGMPATSGQIEGYTSAISVASGERVEVKVSVNPAGAYGYRVFRMGHYGGKGAREVATGGPLEGRPQAGPSFDAATGLVRVSWPTSFELDTQGWLTGVYLVKLERADGWQSYVPFIVRDDKHDAEVVLQLPTATWQAYNRWGGESLYYSSHGMTGGKARKVSYDRPIHSELGWGSGLFLSQERPGVAWMESNGYDIEYLASSDVGGEKSRLGGTHKLYLTIGHDEYNSLEAIERLGKAAEAGTNLAFLTGNTLYWQVRWEDGGRTEVCYKDQVPEDPMVGVDDAHVATAFRSPPVNRPEIALVGVMSEGRAVRDNVPWIVADGGHWLYEGTGLATGDKIAGLVGFEWDTLYDVPQVPQGIKVLADSPVNDFRERHNATIYQRGEGFVFAAGTIDFARRLDDDRVARMLRNVLAKAGAERH